uniref:Ubiquitin-like modifier-activating enzyme ATG7 n=1 Tax=Mesocestoides corti TaxID=53468 RepID=A0A5K3FF12_MESCO
GPICLRPNPTPHYTATPVVHFTSVYWHSTTFNFLKGKLRMAAKKLDEYRLEEGPFPMSGEFTNGTPVGIAPRMSIDHASLNGVNSSGRGNLFRVNGYLFTINTIDKFRTMDKQAQIDEFGRKHICGEAVNSQRDFLRHPNKLLTFFLSAFCDLKHHKFYYWFSFPAVSQVHKPQLLSKTSITTEFSQAQLGTFLPSYDAWRQQSGDAFFCLKATPDGLAVANLETLDIGNKSHYVGFCDPSSHADFPGWALRNLLFALSTTVKDSQAIKVICFRDRYFNQERNFSHSLVLGIKIEPESASEDTRFVGWEKWKGKLQPRFVNLSSTMDPVKLATSAVDLNLKLMLWRMLPNIDLGVLHKTRCLILGSGTLGCNVARQLLAWGFQSITFVDNSTVSYSNPARQTLFTFEDAKSGTEKAVAAAEALKRILPSVNASAHNLTIPMPGHPVSNASAGSNASSLVESVREACSNLDELVQNHDVVFLLLDTREARWLPTLLATYHGKLAITAALGFDTFLVLRHGLPRKQGTSPSSDRCVSGESSKKIDGGGLGCYFCNDVVGPANSTRDRTLDQQCTVARPGASMVASALAVELCVGLLQHPDGGFAPAGGRSDADCPGSQDYTFGFLPHQIRGFLSQFSEVVPCTAAFSRCSACSQPVLDAYAKGGFDFLLRVFDEPGYLEEVSGLKELQLETYFDEVSC